MNWTYVIWSIYVVAIILTAFLIGRSTWSKRGNDTEFLDWFHSVQEMAQYYGYRRDQIVDFDPQDWYEMWQDAFTPEEAVKLKLKEL